MYPGSLLPGASVHSRFPYEQRTVPEYPAFAHTSATYMTLSATCARWWSTHPRQISKSSTAFVTALELL